MATKSFFSETGDQSVVKTAIVTKYFWAWANVISSSLIKLGGNRIAYLDLFAGPGRYEDGTDSTPLLILQQAIENERMQKMLVTIFNDKDEKSVRSLSKAIDNLAGVNKLSHKPIVWNEEVGDEMVKLFAQMNLVPTLFFVDPWGYKGLSLELVNAVVKNWACECIFFFNYNRVSMGLGNKLVKKHMDALFGEEAADELRLKIEGLSPNDRELAIVEALCQALNPSGKRFVLPFRFRDSRGTRTSHHLIFVSKNFKGYEIMKDVMAKESSSHPQGVPSFEYSPADSRFPTLFEMARPLDDLQGLLLEVFAGRNLQMADIYREHSVGTPYIKRNYKKVLLEMERDGVIKTNPAKRRKNTFADSVRVSFGGG